MGFPRSMFNKKKGRPPDVLPFFSEKGGGWEWIILFCAIVQKPQNKPGIFEGLPDMMPGFPKMPGV